MQRQKRQHAQAAYKAVFEDADSFSTYDFDAEAAASLVRAADGYSDEISMVCRKH